jgi:pimeloyl-ACP methyl ester carboxylesterase
MPYANNQGVRIWWEEMGVGEPVLAIMGLSFPLEMWHRTAPKLARKHRVILFDNRGVGRSDVPPGPYLIRRMASDARAVLDAAGAPSAVVMGASMGGMIAQELALCHPERIRALILGCTWCGGIRAVRPSLGSFPRLAGYASMTPEQKMRAIVPMLYTDETPPERIDEDIAMRLRGLPSTRGYYSQLVGTLLWSSWGRLPRIQAPVKIMHGERDRLIPVANAHLLASRISNSRLTVIPDAGHVFTTDQPEFSNREALAFLEEVFDGRAVLSLDREGAVSSRDFPPQRTKRRPLDLQQAAGVQEEEVT